MTPEHRPGEIAPGGIWMPIELPEDEERFLIHAVQQGDAMLVLGAGASYGSTNSAKQNVLMAEGLARTIAAAAGQSYVNESLTDVLGGVGEYLSEVQLQNIYRREYQGVTPSEGLSDLFKYSWKRVYTWNIDDSVQNITQRTAQIRRYFNGIADRVAEYESGEFLHVVYLHGQVQHPDKGLIMTEAQYAKTVASGTHKWYARAAQDYLAYTPIFIGSKLDEPILRYEIERAMRDPGSTRGRGYLVVPDELTTLQRLKFRNQGIFHIRATLDEFVLWLNSKFPSGIRPNDVLANHDIRISRDDLGRLTAAERESAWSIRPLRLQALEAEVAALPEPARAALARRFLRGMAADWILASSTVPVWLDAANGLHEAFSISMASRDRLFTALGQAGSGKSTAMKQVLLRYIAENDDVVLYELQGDVKSPRATLSLLDKLHDQRVILYVPDLFLLGDAFAADLQSLSAGKITVVATARTSEWAERLQRHFGEIGVSFVFQKFGANDFDPLIDRLIRYVPAPKFVRMSRSQQIDQLRKSRSQLLIALREATESRRFDDIITDEYESLPDEDTRLLLLIVGLGTLARVGIAPDAAKEAYERLARSRSFSAALKALDGIVAEDVNGRLVARHELYVRHVFDELVDFYKLRDAVIELLRGFTKYNIPIIKNVNRRDAQLFRFIINHDFVLRRARASGKSAAGLGVYEEFEVDFQLDGHYWLQYGLYLSELGRLDSAAQMLRRSIQAFPDNDFAVHAYADLQLKIALRRDRLDRGTTELVQEAVAALQNLDSRSAIEVDHYPIVTLANGHLAILVRFGREKEARAIAPNYFDRLQQISKRVSSSQVDRTRERVFRFVTLGEWADAAHGARPRGARFRSPRRDPKER